MAAEYWRDLQRREEQKLRAEATAREAELKMLRYQPNPHFLFNPLNSTSALVCEDPERAEQMLNEFSEFLRYSLTHTGIGNVRINGPGAPIRPGVRRFASFQLIAFIC